jgi:pantoate--beta-alanine ligase
MKIVKSIPALRKLVKKARQENKTVGFVPTMGALHVGHASLLRQARRDNDLVILSIFVNPTQFGPKEDFKKYPRTLKSDEKIAKDQGVDILFYPTAEIIYPTNYLTYVEVSGITNILCGGLRPGHFKGVATIVAKLINIVTPDVMYLGQKDAQQVIVLKKMMTDLNFSTTVKVCPTIRESDGLALSSRNRYLNLQDRQQAKILYQSLQLAKQKIKDGEKSVSKLIRLIKSNITSQTSGKIDYVSIVDADTLAEMKTIGGKVMIALSVKFGGTRLIDNVIVHT